MNITLEKTKTDSTEWIFSSTSRESGMFSANQVVDAYTKGKRAGKDEVNEIIQNELDNRIDIVGKQTLALKEYLEKMEIVPSDAFLRVNSLKSFDVLVVIKEKDFLSNKMSKIYKHIANIPLEASCVYNFNFVSKEGLNVDAVISDDYLLRHKFNAASKKARRA